MTLEQDNEDPVFKCGISVAPVTSWLLYDSIYTERYMALPSDNVQGYNHSVITGYVPEKSRNCTSTKLYVQVLCWLPQTEIKCHSHSLSRKLSTFTSLLFGLDSITISLKLPFYCRIENLKTKQWMLNHGVADDNVHFQHSMLLTKVFFS